MENLEHRFTCPYCSTEISMLLDDSVPKQSFIEDCERCCRPIEINYEVEENALVSFTAERST